MLVFFSGGEFQFSDSLTVFPKRVYHNDLDYPVRRHFHKRSVRELWDDNVNYIVEFGEKSIKLNLARKDDLVAPGVTVQHFKGNLTWLEEHSTPNSVSCFYEGTVSGSGWSHASLSLCDGMVRHFLTCQEIKAAWLFSIKFANLKKVIAWTAHFPGTFARTPLLCHPKYDQPPDNFERMTVHKYYLLYHGSA